MFDVVDDRRPGEEVVGFDQAVLDVVRQQQNRHVAAPELLLVDGEGLPSVLDGGERLRHDVVAGDDEILLAAVGLGRKQPVDDVADAGGGLRVGVRPQIIEDRLRTAGPDPSSASRNSALMPAAFRVAISESARSRQVASPGCWSPTTTLPFTPIAMSRLRRQRAGGLLVGSRAKQENVVGIAHLRAGRRRSGAAECDAGRLGARRDVGIGGILREFAKRDAVGLGRDRLFDLLDLVRDRSADPGRCR